MNIKELGNYELVNNNTSNPVLIGTPTFYNFSVQTRDANSAITNDPVFDIADQIEVNGKLKDIIYAAADSLDQVDSKCGYWWYISDIKSEYIAKTGTVSVEDGFLYYLVLSATVIVVADRNIPSTSPSGV
jgi:hypothetical protein